MADKKDVKKLLEEIKKTKTEEPEEELVAPEPPKESDKSMNQMEMLHNSGLFRLQLIYELQQISKHLEKLSSFLDD